METRTKDFKHRKNKRVKKAQVALILLLCGQRGVVLHGVSCALMMENAGEGLGVCIHTVEGTRGASEPNASIFMPLLDAKVLLLKACANNLLKTVKACCLAQ